MRLILPVAILSVFSSLPCFSQNFVGQWKGQFVDKSVSTGDWGGDNCEYILEIQSSGNNNVTGYSYTYFSENGKKYYTICSLEGVIDPKQKFLEVRETGRTKTNVPSNIRNCFQVHRLTYFKKGNEESLSGDWLPAPGQEADCGYGKTSLSRRILDKAVLATNNSSAKSVPSVNTKNQNAAVAVPSNAISNTSKAKALITTANTPSVTKKIEMTENSSRDSYAPEAVSPLVLTNPDKAPNPHSFEKRSTNVIKTIEIEKKSFRIDIFDNGEIDGDSISLFFNGELIIANKRLTDKPISLSLTLKDEVDANDLEMYAENLGTIPPNTAVMTVTDGSKRYDLRVTSDLRKNGVIRFVQRK